MGLQDFLLRKTIERQMKDVPKEQQEQLINMIQQNPELFNKIGAEIKAKIDSGQEQLVATMDVMKKYEAELKKIKKNDH